MNTICPTCLTTNRVAESKLSVTGGLESAKCGHCHEPLFTGSVIEATALSFDKLLQDELPIVIDFWAPWCGPCRNFAPVFALSAEEQQGKIRFLKVNTEAEPALSARFRIRSIPTLMLFHKGKQVDILNGALPKAAFDQWLSSSLPSESV